MLNMAKKTSAANLKSSVYQPVATNLFGQLMTEEHMNSHYRKINKAKCVVDNKSPVSYLVQCRNKNKLSSTTGSSRPSSRLSQLSSQVSHLSSNWNHDQDEAIIRKALRLPSYANKGSDPLCGLKTSDKMALYVDVMREAADKERRIAELKKSSRNSKASLTSLNSLSTKCDVLESHPKMFTKPSNSSFTPRTLVNNGSRSKLSQLRCYNPPVKQNSARKTTVSSKNNLAVNNGCSSNRHNKWLNEQAKKAVARKRGFVHIVEPSPDSAYNDSIRTESNPDDDNCDKESNVDSMWSNEDEELKYLQFVSEITDEIVCRGIFTNRVLKQVLKSRMQKRSNDLSLSKMKLLIDQLRDDLGIPANDGQDELEAGLGSASSNIMSKPSRILDMFTSLQTNGSLSRSSSEKDNDLISRLLGELEIYDQPDGMNSAGGKIIGEDDHGCQLGKTLLIDGGKIEIINDDVTSGEISSMSYSSCSRKSLSKKSTRSPVKSDEKTNSVKCRTDVSRSAPKIDVENQSRFGTHSSKSSASKTSSKVNDVCIKSDVTSATESEGRLTSANSSKNATDSNSFRSSNDDYSQNEFESSQGSDDGS